MRIYPRNNQKTAIQLLDYALSQPPFAVQTIQTDNGAEFHWHVLDKGINHVYILTKDAAWPPSQRGFIGSTVTEICCPPDPLDTLPVSLCPWRYGLTVSNQVFTLTRRYIPTQLFQPFQAP